MKKISIVFLICLSLVGYSQETEEVVAGPQGRHELRLDAFEALVFKTIEFNYEYVMSKYSGAGAAISINLDSELFDYGSKFAFTPYYRQYFLNRKEYGARGLFVEGALQFGGGKYTYYDYVYDPSTDYYLEGVEEDNWFQAGVGVSIGQKWVSNNGFIFEISAGGGRYLLKDDVSPEGYFRGGLLVGYRF